MKRSRFLFPVLLLCAIMMSACQNAAEETDHTDHNFSISFINETNQEITVLSVDFAVNSDSKPFAVSTIGAPYSEPNDRPPMEKDQLYTASFSCASLPGIETPPLEQISLTFDLEGETTQSATRTYDISELWNSEVRCTLTKAGLLEIELFSS